MNQQKDPWNIDSGATHHITSDAQSLNIMHDYYGSEEIAIENGNTIPITHISNTNLSASNYDLKLLNTLLPLAIKSNLISISKFCQDNLTFIEVFLFIIL